MNDRFRNVSGPQIKAIRISRGLSQGALAAKLQLAGLTNIDRVLVAKIEGCIRSIYDYELAVIAKVLSVELHDLVPEEKLIQKQLPRLVGNVIQ